MQKAPPVGFKVQDKPVCAGEVARETHHDYAPVSGPSAF